MLDTIIRKIPNYKNAAIDYVEAMQKQIRDDRGKN
jgi:hypothetical protein